jgi:hypothetical protein
MRSCGLRCKTRTFCNAPAWKGQRGVPSKKIRWVPSSEIGPLRNPGLKSETWAIHSTFVRVSSCRRVDMRSERSPPRDP